MLDSRMSTVSPQPTRWFTLPQQGESFLVYGKRYYIGERIGNGSFGEVFHCFDEWRNDLAAKVLTPRGLPYEVIRDSWLEELRKLKIIRHPNGTYLYDAFEINHTFYLIMEHCPMTLDRLIEMPNMEGDVWLPHLARDILQGLEYIHVNNYVHKDIHPGNIFISQSYDRMVPSKQPVWSFKIGDLGISRLADEVSLLRTTMNQAMIPPEVLDPAQFGPVGKSIDIYQTGLLLLAILLNKVPTFSHDEIVAGTPRELAESLTSKYAFVVAKALRRHVSARPPTALDLWREISSVG